MSDEALRLVMVHAHPDDESSKGAATAARYVAEGVDVHVVTCTGGERGSVLNPALDTPEVRAELPATREREMARAREVLGVRHHWLGYVDSGWPEGNPLPTLPDGCFALRPLDEPVAALVGLLRALRPHVVTTYDERGGYPHPDHVMAHRVAVRAYEAAGDPGYRPDLGTAWAPAKLYFDHVLNRARMQAINAAMVEAGREPPYQAWLQEWAGDAAARVTTRVRCEQWFEVRDRALRAHATQVDPQGEWFAVPLDVERSAWPTEDFELARSAVETAVPEDDLFAGLRD